MPNIKWSDSAYTAACMQQKGSIGLYLSWMYIFKQNIYTIYLLVILVTKELDSLKK